MAREKLSIELFDLGFPSYNGGEILLEHLWDACLPFYTQTIKTNRSGVFSYSDRKVNTPVTDQDPYIRGGGEDLWESLAQLWINVKKEEAKK